MKMRRLHAWLLANTPRRAYADPDIASLARLGPFRVAGTVGFSIHCDASRAIDALELIAGSLGAPTGGPR